MRSRSAKLQDTWIFGGILAILGLYLIIDGDVKGGFVLLGFGIVYMSATNEKFREKLLDFFFSIFKNIWNLLSNIVSK
jgi:phage-related protein